MMLKSELLRPEVYFKAVRSRGPGGQNVNRTSSAAILFWDFAHSHLLSSEQKDRLRTRLEPMINSEGLIYIRSDEFRDLEMNKSRCLEKLAKAVATALHVPKKRKATKPTKASRLRRQEGKTQRAETKNLRKKVEY